MCCSGGVPGRGIRYSTRHIAAGLRVTGYVQNLSDGRVLLVAEGPPGELDRLLAAIDRQMGATSVTPPNRMAKLPENSRNSNPL